MPGNNKFYVLFQIHDRGSLLKATQIYNHSFAGNFYNVYNSIS
jgi:hypothetical protein